MSAPALLAADAPASAPPLATVFGEAVLDAPADLFIPPDALRVFLESFEGPLDLLLYLIRKQNLNVLDIPMARVTAQYMEYIGAMRAERMELAAEYLLMAALLIEIKSRLLLPRPPRRRRHRGALCGGAWKSRRQGCCRGEGLGMGNSSWGVSCVNSWGS